MHRRAQAGTTILEMMVALCILLVVMTGFWSAVFQSVNSTGISQRRTVGNWLRADMVDRLTLSSRDSLRGVITASNEKTWIIDQCYDNGGRPTTGNPALLTSFACGATDGYRRWINVEPTTQQVNEFGFAGPIWRVQVYVENIANGC